MTGQTMLRLRPYQREAIDALFTSWTEIQRPAAVLATGLGKTVIFSHLVSEFAATGRGRQLILVHRDELADQTISKLHSIAPHLKVGKVKASDNDVTADVMVASVQTLARQNRMDQLLAATLYAGHIGLVVVDECFPAGTLVGGTPIEKLQPGDLVPTWNEDTGREELRPVVRVMKRTPSAMVRVSLEDGSSFACTPNHPILTSGGWCPAGMLTRGALTVSFTHDAEASERGLHGVRSPRDLDGQAEDRHLSFQRTDVLLGHVQRHVGVPECFRAHGPDKPPVRIGADATQQPHAQTGVPGEDVRDPAAHQAQAARTGRERFGSDGAAAQACGVPGLADGSRRTPGGRGTPVPLQAGHRSPFDEGLRGGGRGIPLLSGAPSLRPEAGRTAVLTRVADVQILQSGGDGTYGGVCPDGAVYNLEVDTTHTYLINDGLVVHNCHHAAAVSYRNILAVLGCFSGAQDGQGRFETVAAGFTATMARGDGQGLGGVWQDVPYVRSVLWGIRNGFLTDVRAQQIDLEGLDLGAVKKSGGDYTAKSLGDALLEADAPRAVHQVLTGHAADRRSVIVFTPTVAVAQETAAHLNAQGMTADLVHGGTPREDRLKIYERFRRGTLRVLVNCMVLTEGADFPFADCALIARPTRSDTLFIQMAGRVLRPSPQTGKTDALLLLLAGQNGSIRTLIDLDDTVIVPPLDGESLAEAYDRQEEIREEQEARRAARENAKPKVFRIQSRSVDLFASSPAYQWLTTTGGVQFIPLGGNGWLLLWPSQGGEGLWDVVHVPEQARVPWERLHTGLDLGPAMAWAESEADERSHLNTGKSAGWRRKPASERMLRFATQYRLRIPEGTRAGEASDMIAVAQLSKKVDRYMTRA